MTAISNRPNKKNFRKEYRINTLGDAFVKLGFPVEFVDERCTSFEAESIIGNHREKKNLIDKVAASIILQLYLDERRKSLNESKNH